MPVVSKMENPEKLPILKLPYVALKEVLNKMSPLDVINFSLTSLKTKVITTLITKCFSKKHEISFTFCSDLKLSIDEMGGGYGYGYEMTSDKSKRELVITDDLNSEICLKFSEDILNGFMKWSEYVMQILNYKIRSVGFFVDEIPDQTVPTIDWLKSFTSTLVGCHVEGKKESDDLLHHILNNFEITYYMNILVPTKENFTSKLPKISDSVIIEPSKWVTLQQIFDLDCESIVIMSSSLSNQDLTSFVTSWMAMESNLNLFRFETDIKKKNDLAEIVEGLPEERLFFGIHEAAEKRFQRQIDGAWTVTRNDGKQAVLYTYRFQDQLSLFFITI